MRKSITLLEGATIIISEDKRGDFTATVIVGSFSTQFSGYSISHVLAQAILTQAHMTEGSLKAALRKRENPPPPLPAWLAVGDSCMYKPYRWDAREVKIVRLGQSRVQIDIGREIDGKPLLRWVNPDRLTPKGDAK